MRNIGSASLQTNKLKTLFLNARSLRNKISELKAIVSTESYDLIAISETWIKQTDIDSEFNISGYDKIAKHRIHQRGGGIILYYKKFLELEHCYIETLKDLEVIVVRINNVKTKLLLSLIY